MMSQVYISMYEYRLLAINVTCRSDVTKATPTGKMVTLIVPSPESDFVYSFENY